jgi:hypothetical protein
MSDGWRVWGDPYTTAEMSNSSRHQKVEFDDNYILKAVRTWVIIYNNPTFTSLNMKVYSDNAGVPGKLLHTSTNNLLKSEIHTLDNGVKEIYFDFNEIPVRSGDIYHFVINASGYTGSETSHIAWMKAFPDPVYATGLTVSFSNLLYLPYQLYFIGSEL